MKPDIERKKHFNAPLHVRKRRMHVHLAPELRAKAGTRAILVRKGDKVKVMRGDHKGEVKTVARVDYRFYRVYLEGVSRRNARGEERLIPFHPSNLMLVTPVETKERRAKYPSLFASPAQESKEVADKG